MKKTIIIASALFATAAVPASANDALTSDLPAHFSSFDTDPPPDASKGEQAPDANGKCGPKFIMRFSVCRKNYEPDVDDKCDEGDSLDADGRCQYGAVFAWDPCYRGPMNKYDEVACVVILRGGPRLSGGARSAVGHPVPGQEFAEPGLRRVGDLGKSVGEPSLRIDLVELCGLNQRVHDRGALSPAL